MAGRSRVEQRRSAPAEPRLDAVPRAPTTQDAVLALQRSAGNQATAAVLARMENGQEEDAADGSWRIVTYFYSWLDYFRGVAAQTPADETQAEEPTPTAPQQAPVTAEAAPVTTQAAPATTQAAPATTQQAPFIGGPAPTAPTRTSGPLSPDERTEFRKQLSSFENTLESTEDKDLAQKIRKACHLIKRALEPGPVSSSILTQASDAIDVAQSAMPRPQKQRSSNNATSSSQDAAEAPESMPVDVLIGGEMGDQAAWPYHEVVLEAMNTMATGGGVTLGRDGQPIIALAVRAHWQQGDKGQHFVKVYLDAADKGGGTKLRAYFRYLVVNGRLILKLVAIREEHSGVDKTLVGNKQDRIGPDGS